MDQICKPSRPCAAQIGLQGCAQTHVTPGTVSRRCVVVSKRRSATKQPVPTSIVLQGRDHATSWPLPSKPCIACGEGAPNDVVKSGRGAFQSSAWSFRGGDGSGDAVDGGRLGRQATWSSSDDFENMARPKATKSPRSQSRQSSAKSWSLGGGNPTAIANPRNATHHCASGNRRCVCFDPRSQSARHLLFKSVRAASSTSLS
mmetsp:Transcript_26610/g.69140  ORF Transcript_26610/g.69140 Transcript_26610/m.69140 type:complete len:202 (+) Transcript_26610:1672-2277(+)